MKALDYISELPPYALWALSIAFVGWVMALGWATGTLSGPGDWAILEGSATRSTICPPVFAPTATLDSARLISTADLKCVASAPKTWKTYVGGGRGDFAGLPTDT